MSCADSDDAPEGNRPLCAGLLVGLAGAIVTVSMLSARERISLTGGIAVFVIDVVSWATVAVVLGVRWWRWSRRDQQTSARVLVAHGSRRGRPPNSLRPSPST